MAPGPGIVLANKPRDLVAMAVLGLLLERDRHPYEMQRTLGERGTSWISGLPRSLYHAIDRLVHDGSVEAREVVREGARPERTVYGITDHGREEFRHRLAMLLAEPSDDITFFVALSLMGGITRDEAVGALRRRVARLEGGIARTAAQLASLRATLPRLALIEVEFQAATLDAELAWVREVIADAESGALSWELDAGAQPPTT